MSAVAAALAPKEKGKESDISLSLPEARAIEEHHSFWDSPIREEGIHGLD
jgi:hypothetical protein